jgi:group I intron endonuclease
MIGIYKITTTHNNKVYIGYSSNIELRFKQHKNCLKNNNHDNMYLQNTYNKYGENIFSFEILEECPYELCIEKEHYYVSFYKSNKRKHGYNLANTGIGKIGKMPKKIILKSIQIRKNNAKIRGYYFSKEIIKKQVNARKGWKHSEDAKIKIGLSSKGRKKSNSAIEQHKKQIQKQVNQYSLEGEFIKTWHSITDALIFLNKDIKSGHISSCCKNKKQTAYGYKWKYNTES